MKPHYLLCVTIAVGLAAPQIGSCAGQTKFTILYTFPSDNPVGITAASGVFYGATQGPAGNGTNCGTAFELQPPAGGGGVWTESVIYEYGGALTDPCEPQTAPVAGPGGALYGTTPYYGAYNFGAFYELTPPVSPGGTWTQTLLFSFGPLASDGLFPDGPLIPGPNGSFYVLTGAGGANGNGALVQLTPPAAAGEAWSGTNLYSFPPDTLPFSLTLGAGGVFYGAAAGAVFQLTPPATPGGSWAYTVLYSLPAYTGFAPRALTVASDGTIYGVSGATPVESGTGAVFQMAPPASSGAPWTFTILHGFGAGAIVSPLVLHQGRLYGTVANTPQSGAVFGLQPPTTPGGPWPLSYLHQFTGGVIPYGPLVIRGSMLYGVSQAGAGDPLSGTVYAIALK